MLLIGREPIDNAVVVRQLVEQLAVLIYAAGSRAALTPRSKKEDGC